MCIKKSNSAKPSMAIATVDDEVKHHKMQFLASVLCIDGFTIRRAHPRRAHPSRAHPRRAHPSRAHPCRAHPCRAHPRRAHPSHSLYDYCITQGRKKDTIANTEELCRNGTITEAACISSIGEASAAEKQYEEVLNEIQRVLDAFTSLRMCMALELDQIFALRCALILDEIQQDIPRSDQYTGNQVAILKKRYIRHVNNTSWSPARFANIRWRIVDLC